MALNTYLTLKLDNVPVQAASRRKGREGTIQVTSLEWSFDSDGNVGEVKFTAELDRETPPISAGLKSDAVADGLFDFYQPSQSGIEAKVFTLHGTNGKVTSVNVWMLNNKDPNLMRYDDDAVHDAVRANRANLAADQQLGDDYVGIAQDP